eukprot:PhM_4_TR15489/c0_g2_i1/m.56160/K01613/psd, PISD; phosphatidylserine decarboxylase
MNAQSYLAGHRNAHWTNPIRRWVYHKMFAYGVLGGLGLVGFGYFNASLTPEGPSTVAYPVTVSFLTHVAPFNSASRLLQTIASDTNYVPRWVHQWLILHIAEHYSDTVDFRDYEGCYVGDYDTLQEFFERDFADHARPLHQSATVVSPCDGQLLRVGDLTDTDWIEQVKGFSYRIENFLRVPLQPTSPPVGHKRMYAVVGMNPADVHRFVAPVDMAVQRTAHIAGSLMPVTFTSLKWLPRLLVSNERVIISSEGCVVAAVGSTGYGSIHLDWEQRVKTNEIVPSNEVQHRVYSKPYSMLKGTELGRFSAGSAVVVIVDVPVEAKVAVPVKSRVKRGQALFDVSSNSGKSSSKT